MLFECGRPDCNYTQEVPELSGDAAIEALEDRYGWAFIASILTCHECAWHK